MSTYSKTVTISITHPETDEEFFVNVEVDVSYDSGYRYNKNGDGLPSSIEVDDWRIKDWVGQEPADQTWVDTVIEDRLYDDDVDLRNNF